MKKALADKFDEIQQEAIYQAEAVNCSQRDFLEGLKIMLDMLQARIESYADEIGATHG